MNTLDSTWKPTTATTSSTAPRILRAQFGDGYNQEMLDGINAYLRNWEVTWEPIHGTSLTVPTLDQLDQFFRANAGLRFLWTQPPPCDDEGPKVFRCREWSWTYSGGLITGLRAAFEQQAEN
jgi:phage-related protein